MNRSWCWLVSPSPEETDGASASSGAVRGLARVCLILGKRRVQLDDNELVVVRLSGTHMAPDAEREIVIVEHADVVAIEEEHIF